MKVSPEGRVTWEIPLDLDGDEVTPIVLIKDASGQEVLYTFNIRLERPRETSDG